MRVRDQGCIGREKVQQGQKWDGQKEKAQWGVLYVSWGPQLFQVQPRGLTSTHLQQAELLVKSFRRTWENFTRSRLLLISLSHHCPSSSPGVSWLNSQAAENHSSFFSSFWHSGIRNDCSCLKADVFCKSRTILRSRMIPQTQVWAWLWVCSSKNNWLEG